MAFGIGQLGNIIQDFTNAVSEIFGISSNSSGGTKGGKNLFKAEYGGSPTFTPSKWLGNTQGVKVRYGFTLMNADEVRSNSGSGKAKSLTDQTAFYLDIPPQAIKQKEVFATNITATRKGIIVESEGVVFKDIVIQGTTGVFPGTRGGANTPGSNLFTDPFKAPTAPAGVSPDTGKSRASNVKTISGYEEFMRLRQYFLSYAAEKVKADGNLFLIFINEKDDQALIVEPLEFEMERNSKSPMTYQYKIVLKAIGNLNTIFSGAANSSDDVLGILSDIGNLSANISATLKQSQAVIGASNQLLSRFSQALDQTFVNPLRQLQLAIKGLSDGTSNVLSLPEILIRNVTSENLLIAENINEIGRSITNISYSTSTDQETRLTQTAEFQKQQQVRDRMLTDTKVPIPRSFVEQVSLVARNLSDDLADFTNLGDPLYDQLKGRTPTQQSESSKVVSDDEFLLMGALQQVTSDLAMSIASNGMFAADADIAFEQSQALFQNPNIPIESQITITKPESVREVTIQRGDILERIAQREYGDAGRWLDLVVLNKLKPPYIDEAGGDGIKRPGETLLVGNK